MASGKNKGKKRPPPKRPAGAAPKPQTRPPASTPPAGAPSSPAPTTKTTGRPKPSATPTAGAGGSKPTRAERLEAARRARKRKALLTRVGIGAAVAVIIGLVVTTVVRNNRVEAKNRERLTAGSCTFDTRSDPTDAPAQSHVPPAGYEVDPPAGGNHDPSAAAAGVYDGETRPAPPVPQLVHSLEHGYIVLWHKPGLTDDELEQVQEAYDAYPKDVLVVPHATVPGKVAATAWGKRLLCTDIEPETLTEFVRLYRNEGPEDVPH